MVAPGETNSQRTRRRVGAGLKKTWPNVRTSLRPRGLQNGPGKGIIAACYRICTLQMLAHLPKFVNWVMQHNDPDKGSDWPCRAEDPNRRLPHMQENDRAILNMDQNLVMGCVPCRLKEFVTQYWGKIRVGANEHPESFAHGQASTLPLHRLGERWMCRLPDAGEKSRQGETTPEFAARRLAKETVKQRSTRVSHACGQQCADEFLGFIREGLKESIDPTNQRRQDEYKALFMLQRHEETRCSHCNTHRGTVEYEFSEEVGFPNIKPRLKGSDNLLSALENSTWLATDTNEALKCGNCNENGATTSKQIEAAPEYLRIHFDLSTSKGGNKVSVVKNKTPIDIPDILDLTHHVYTADAEREARPLRYKLISILYHAGATVTNGHWTAGVSHPIAKQQRGKRKPDAPSSAYYFCNDENIQEWSLSRNVNPLTRNPEKRAGSEYNAVVLMYERLPRVAPKRDYTAELKIGLDDKYYAVGKEGSGGDEKSSKKRKQVDDGEEKGLRRSKRLKQKNP